MDIEGHLALAAGAWGKGTEVWLGISLDEWDRMKDNG